MFTKYYNQKKELKLFTCPSWMTHSRVNYEDIKDISNEEIEDVISKFYEIEKENNAAIMHNSKLYHQAEEEFLDELRAIGVTVEGTRGGVLQPFKNTLREIKYKISRQSSPAMPNPYTYYNGEEVRLFGSLADRIKRLKHHGLCETERELKNNKTFRAAYEYIIKNDIEVSDGADANEIISTATKHAEEKFVSENFPDGTVINIDDNYCECETWTVGEHRCSCGNRRIYLQVEGNLLDGFYAYGAPF